MTADFESFSSTLADVLFRDSPREIGSLGHEVVVERFEQWFRTADATQVHIMAGYIDRTLVANVPGAQQLAIARIIQSLHPRLISRMPTLSARQDHLRRSHELAQIFMPDSLSRLMAAIAKEVS